MRLAAFAVPLATIIGDPVQWLNDYGYYAVFVMVFIETAGVPVPGETTMLLAGAAANAPGATLHPVQLAIVAAVAAIAGDNVGYAIGRFGGRRLVLRLSRYGRVADLLAWGEMFFERHGGKTVFFARWTAGLRIFGAWIAGMTHMPWPRFLVWNAAGGITWAAGITALGYFFSKSLGRVEDYVGTGGAIAAGVVLFAALLWGLRKISHRRREGVAEPVDEPES